MTAVAERALYAISDAMSLLSMSRTVIYEQIRAGRLDTVHHRAGAATSPPRPSNATWRCSSPRPGRWRHDVAGARAAFTSPSHASGGSRPPMSASQLTASASSRRRRQTKTEAKNKLKKSSAIWTTDTACSGPYSRLQRPSRTGWSSASPADPKTIDTCRMLANGHVIPDWGPVGPGAHCRGRGPLARARAPDLSRATLQRILSILRRSCLVRWLVTGSVGTSPCTVRSLKESPDGPPRR